MLLIRAALAAVIALTLCSQASAALGKAGAQSIIENTAEGETSPPLTVEDTEENLDAIIANAVAPPLTEPVRVRSGMLTVKLEGAAFGQTLEEIGRQAGFEVAVSPEIASKQLSTTFRDMELQKGIQRLLSLISHRNFFIYYGADDSITRIEVYYAGEVQKPSRSKQNFRPNTRQKIPTPGVTRPRNTGVYRTPAQDRNENLRTVPGRSPVRKTPAVTRRAPSSQAQDQGEKDVPYIVPQQEPQYVPPYNRRRR